jgi:hypothetical protein
MSLDNEQPPKVIFSEIKKSLKEDFDPSKITKSISKLPMKLYRGWGMLFRFIFIASIGFLGYQWVEGGPSIVDTPFSQLTLGIIIRGLLTIAIPLGCLGWFFSFPDYNDPEDKDNPYYLWANGSFLLIGIIVIVWLLWFR